MSSKNMTTLELSCVLLMMFSGLASSDLNKDRADCADQLVGLATCLPYVGGESKAPTIDCCTGLKQVVKTSQKCLCVLIKDRDDPNLGLKINATLALGLPTTCHAPVNISECVSLLQLPPNSPDAKMFEDFEKSTKGSNSTSSSTTPVASAKGNSTSNGSSEADLKNDGGRRKSWLGVEMVGGLLLFCLIFTPHPIFDF